MVSLKIFGTPVKVKETVLAPVVLLWGGLTWWGMRRHPKRGLGHGLLIGFLTLLVLTIVDIGHALAHIFSARYARAPMDEVLITANMPRTLYWNNDVSPDQHRLRALGGPIFNALAFLLSLTIYRLVPRNSLARELSGWSTLGHGLLFILCLVPLPVVDGGTLLKWTLVARGRSQADADELVRRIDLGIAALVGAFGAALVGRQIAGSSFE
jgi:hypothetical protein